MGWCCRLMIANMTAFVLARHWRPIPVYEALLLQDGIELPHGARPLDPPHAAEIGAERGDNGLDGVKAAALKDLILVELFEGRIPSGFRDSLFLGYGGQRGQVRGRRHLCDFLRLQHVERFEFRDAVKENLLQFSNILPVRGRMCRSPPAFGG